MNGEQLNGREKYYKDEIEKLQKERGEREKKWETVQTKLKEAAALKGQGKLHFNPASGDDAKAGTKGAGRESERDVDKAYREVIKLVGSDKGSGDWEEGLKQLRKLTGEPEPEPTSEPECKSKLEPEPESEPEPEPEPEPEQKTPQNTNYS